MLLGPVVCILMFMSRACWVDVELVIKYQENTFPN